MPLKESRAITNVSKVRFNLSQNALCLSLSKGSYKPFFWIAVMFALIATITPITQRDNVGDGSSATPTQGSPVIGSGVVEKPIQWALADGAAVVEVVKTILPFGNGQIVRQFTLSGAAFIMVYLYLVAIDLTVIMVVVLNSPLILLSPVAQGSKNRIVMSVAITCRFTTRCFRVALSIALTLLSGLLWVVVIPIQFTSIVTGFTVMVKTIRRTTFSVEEFSSGWFEFFADAALLHPVFIVNRLLANKVYLARLSEFGVLIPTVLATGIQSIASLLSSVEKLRGSRFPFAAIGALLSSHTSSTQDNLHLWCGRAGVEVSPIRTVNYSALVHVPYYSMIQGKA